MVEFFYSIDVELFYFINHTLSNSVFDKFFILITNVKNWYITYIILWSIAFFKGGRIGKVAAIGAIFVIVFSDQLNSSLLKNLFERTRPCNELPGVNALLGCSGSYSFPSSHAVNNFAIAVFFYRLFPKLKWVLLISAGLIAISRPYVGVHYPSDILAGALLGWGIGYLFSVIALKFNDYFEKKFIEKK
ncbi:MAG: phosphatase PAP2 family protein [Ignavibacteria bacterium]|jgi:undecaprenyl-diphosphatase